MIWFYTRVGRDCRLLPQLLEHYQAMGVDRLLVCGDLKEPLDPIKNKIKRICRQYDALFETTIDPGHDHVRVRQDRARQIQKYCDPSDWVINADCDEFHVFPNNLRHVLDYCDDQGFDYVHGTFVDRIAADGSLPVLDESRSVWEQFELGCHITRNVLMARVDKVPASKAAVKLDGGYHQVLGRTYRCCHYEVEVHHFKWDSEVLNRMKWRMEVANHKDYRWACPEAQRLEAYLLENGGKLNIKDPKLQVFTPNNQQRLDSI